MVALTAGCGKKGPPLPPLRPLFPVITEVTAIQRGEDIEVDWRVAPPSGEGRPAGAERYIVLRAPASGAAEGDEAGRGLVLESLAEAASVPVPPESRSGGTFRWRDEGAASEGAPLLYSVTLVSTWKARRATGPLIRVHPATPPPVPKEVRATAEPEGVRIEWAPIENGEVRIYRSAEGEAAPPEPTAVAGEGGRWLDTGAVLGLSYDYRLCAEVEAEGGLETLGEPEEGRERAPWEAAGLPVESRFSPPVSATHADLYPPPVPENLRAFAERDSVVLLWNPVEAPDLLGYNVYRAPPGGEPRLLTKEPVTDTVYRDETVKPGETWVYTVTSLDTRSPPNESAHSAEDRATIAAAQAP